MRVIRSVVIREKPASKGPRIRSSNTILSFRKWFGGLIEIILKQILISFRQYVSVKELSMLLNPFNFGDTMITYEDKVTLFGVSIDFQLNFNHHISQICKTKKHRNS